MSTIRDHIDLVEDAQGGDTALFEMANLKPATTGLPFVVFVSQRGGAKHDVRVKVATTAKADPAQMITVTVRPDVRDLSGKLATEDLRLVERWIDLNRAAIVAYWDGDIEYTEDLMAVLKPI